EIYKIELKEENGVITISFYGEGFLRFMVRMLTQTMIEVGKGRLTTEEVKVLLERKEKNSAPYNATGSGLYLMEVGYEPYKA
ncbi:MAG: tRNA pseudouridine(38-40) synthase TruA, partial [Erysipelotrichaceae bacterium]|nr:tRNA pseudouridine(38-40) synthase TruA [Erysipelotrichaceae bacterium]